MKKSFNLLLCLYIISVLFLIQGCKKGDLPEVITVEVTLVTNNSATTGGEIISDGGCDITEKGVCWNKTGNPVITTDSKTSNGKGSEPFTSNITGLEAGVTYYLRAYATNGPGTAYGEEIVFTTKISDIDGNLYDIIKIGTQVWMAENLKTTKLNDNTSLPNITDNTEWASATLPGYSWYDNNESYSKPLYGALYNWYAASDSKLCPAGWHVPTDAEFQALEITLGLSATDAALTSWRGTDQGTKMKNTTGWSSGQNGTNTSGFSALPGGYRQHTSGLYAGENSLGYWWTSTYRDDQSAWYRRLDGTETKVYRASTLKAAGKSVRCIKD